MYLHFVLKDPKCHTRIYENKNDCNFSRTEKARCAHDHRLDNQHPLFTPEATDTQWLRYMARVADRPEVIEQQKGKSEYPFLLTMFPHPSGQTEDCDYNKIPVNEYVQYTGLNISAATNKKSCGWPMPCMQICQRSCALRHRQRPRVVPSQVECHEVWDPRTDQQQIHHVESAPKQLWFLQLKRLTNKFTWCKDSSE